MKYINAQVPNLIKGRDLRIISLYPCRSLWIGTRNTKEGSMALLMSAVIFPQRYFKVAKAYWQHSGEGVSSRRAEFCQKAYEDDLLFAVDSTDEQTAESSDNSVALCKGPRRYQRGKTQFSARLKPQSREKTITRGQSNTNLDENEHMQFVEERFGRNLDMSLASNAKLAIRRRIAGALTANVELDRALEIKEENPPTRQVQDFSEHDVYLHPTGMSSIFNTHRVLLECRGELKSICFGHVSIFK